MKLLIRIPPTPRGCGFPAHANELSQGLAFSRIVLNYGDVAVIPLFSFMRS